MTREEYAQVLERYAMYDEYDCAVREAFEAGAKALRELADCSICPHEGEARCPTIGENDRGEEDSY